MDVARLVADILHGRARGSDAEVHVREFAVLRDVEAHRNRRRVSILQFEIDVAHATEERELGGIDDGSTGVRPVVGEVDHVAAGAFLKSRRVFGKHEDWTRRSISQETNALPDVDRLAQAIATLGNQQYAGPCRLLHAVDGSLKRVGIVTDAVCMRAECLRGEIHRARIGRSNWVERRGVSGARPEEEGRDESCERGA